jgi:hypothetical protein
VADNVLELRLESKTCDLLLVGKALFIQEFGTPCTGACYKEMPLGIREGVRTDTGVRTTLWT